MLISLSNGKNYECCFFFLMLMLILTYLHLLSLTFLNQFIYYTGHMECASDGIITVLDTNLLQYSTIAVFSEKLN